jgi:hypothetical protein
VARAIQRSAAFDAAVSAQLAYLVEQGRTDWIVRLRGELAEFETTISTFPHIGHERDRERSRVLRKMGLPKAPYYVWYAYDEGERDGPITLLSFFHDRQRGRAPRL